MGWALLSTFPKFRLSSSGFPSACENLLLGTFVYSIIAFIGLLAGYPLFKTSAILITILTLTTIWKNNSKSNIENNSSTISFKINFSTLTTVASLGIIVVGSIAWSINNIEGLKATPTGDFILIPWLDIFYHAGWIGLFAQFKGDTAITNIYMSGEPLPIYHYGSYIVSSTISSIGNIPSLQIATSFYPVFGMALTGASMVMLSSIVTDRQGTLFALFVLFLIPDFSFWMPLFGLHASMERWYSYYFFQQVGIGGCYATAFLGFSLCYALRAFQIKSLWLAFSAVIIFALTSFFKATYVLAYGIFFTTYVCFNLKWKSHLFRISIIVALVSIFILIIAHLNKLPGFPSFFISLDGIKSNAIKLMKPISIEQSANFIIQASAIPLAGCALLIRTYGLIFPVSLLLAWTLKDHKQSNIIINLLITTFISHLFIALFIAPNNTTNGDAYEINHKSFVWPYYVIIFCFSVLLYNYTSTRQYLHKQHSISIISIASIFIAFTIISSFNVQNSFDAHTRNPINKGLLESAIYIKNQSKPSEVVQLCEINSLNELGTLTERPSYIVNIKIYHLSITDQKLKRYDIVKSILDAQDTVIAKSLLTSANISWWLMAPNCKADWEKQIQPIFRSGQYRLYNTSQL